MADDLRYMGKPLHEMDAEELRDCVRQLARQLEIERAHHGRTLDVFGSRRRATYFDGYEMRYCDTKMAVR